jgi:hypothetical protein
MVFLKASARSKEEITPRFSRAISVGINPILLYQLWYVADSGSVMLIRLQYIRQGCIACVHDWFGQYMLQFTLNIL